MCKNWYIVVQDTSRVEHGQWIASVIPAGVTTDRKLACEMAEEGTSADAKARMHIYCWNEDGELRCVHVCTQYCGTFAQVLWNEQPHTGHRDCIFKALALSIGYSGIMGQVADVVVDGETVVPYGNERH